MDIAAWYCNSALNIESLISVTAFETVFDVAGMGAVFSSGIAVGSEGLAAAGAGEFIYSLAVDPLRVGVPPGNPALVRAELDAFLAWGLCKQSAALQAEVGIQINATVVCSFCAGQPYFPAKSDNGIFLQPYGLCDGGISKPL